MDFNKIFKIDTALVLSVLFCNATWTMKGKKVYTTIEAIS